MDESLLVQEYRPRLLYYVLKQVRDRTAAEEITQETLILVIQALRDDRVRERSKLGSYIFGVAKNLIRNHHGKTRRALQTESGIEADTLPWRDHPEAELLLRERIAQLQKAFDRLSDPEKEILRRAVVEADDLQDIAKDMAIPYAATRKRKSRALVRLKNLFLQLSQKRPL